MAGWAVVLLFLLAPALSWARGGGGCLAEGTPVLTPAGPIAIEKLRVGDGVVSIAGGKAQLGIVLTRMEVRADELLEVAISGAKLRITPEHPVMVGRGEYLLAKLLKSGDKVHAVQNGHTAITAVQSIRPILANQPAYNLLVSPGGTFAPAGVVVHNKGCFLPDSPILKADGTEVPISTIRPGDQVLAFTPEGVLVRTTVRNIVRREVDEFMVLYTDRQTLRVTAEHPFYIGQGLFKTLEGLKVGDVIFAWDGQALARQPIVRLETIRERTPVYNLQTDLPNTFFASRFAVHNKGGGSGRSSSSRSSRSGGGGSSGESSGGEELAGIIAFVGAVTIVIIVLIVVKRGSRRKSENLDFVYSSAEVSPKAVKTEKLLDFLSRQDPSLSPQELRKLAEATFGKLQECWQARAYGPMEPLLMPPLFAQHRAQLDGLKKNHEINRIENVRVERVDLVNVRYTEKPAQREFAALLTASARDYYEDDRNGKFLRGDKSPARFQEFWTFHRWGDQWRLREIEQAGESDLLKEENFAEMLTDQTIRGIYGEAAGKGGAAGPWLETSTEEKATRIDRMLNFLVQTDKLWNRQQMLERARQIFLRVHLAEESGDPAQVPVADLFPGPAATLQERIRQRRADGVNVEYRNLCVRKAELILLRNFSDRSKDEFTARISAHAQEVVRKGDRVKSEQPDVTPFEEYWTLGRLDEQWKLKEVMPPARGQKLIAEENVDEDGSPEQLKWYYRHPRAN